MKKLTTHIDVVQNIPLKLLRPSLYSESLAMSLLDFAATHCRLENHDPRSAYLVCKEDITLSVQDPSFRADVNCIAHHTHQHQSKIIDFMVFEDNSVLIQRYPEDASQYEVIPWVFRFPSSFNDGQVSFEIKNPSSYPRAHYAFDHADENGMPAIGKAALLRREGNEHTGFEPMRQAFLAALIPEMQAICAAFDRALPLGSFGNWPQQAQEGRVAAAPFLPLDPPHSDALQEFTRTLCTWVDTMGTPGMTQRIIIDGRSVALDGELCPIKCTIITSTNGRMPELEARIEALFDTDQAPIDTLEQVAQHGEGDGTLIHLTSDDMDEPSAHETLEATSKMTRYMAAVDDAWKIKTA
jgi:hypothetical protein